VARIDALAWSGLPRVEADRVTPGESELLLIRAAQREARAFAPLYEQYVGLVWRYARSRLGSDDRAADATGATFQRALSALPNFEPQLRGDATTFRSWLMTIARNVVIDDARRGIASSLESPDVRSRLVATGRTPEDHAISRDEQARVNTALAQLPDTQRQIVELRLAGLKSVEIAEAMGMNLSAVKTAHFRAYARLRILLAEPESIKDTSHETT
jgi:RNA polymerase sigma-70 factor (ECF subfamily)